MVRSRRCWAEPSGAGYGSAKGVGLHGSHYSWSRSRVNTHQSPIGQCTDLQQEDRVGRSGTVKKTQKRQQKKKTENIWEKIPVYLWRWG